MTSLLDLPRLQKQRAQSHSDPQLERAKRRQFGHPSLHTSHVDKEQLPPTEGAQWQEVSNGFNCELVFHQVDDEQSQSLVHTQAPQQNSAKPSRSHENPLQPFNMNTFAKPAPKAQARVQVPSQRIASGAPRSVPADMLKDVTPRMTRSMSQQVSEANSQSSRSVGGSQGSLDRADHIEPPQGHGKSLRRAHPNLLADIKSAAAPQEPLEADSQQQDDMTGDVTTRDIGQLHVQNMLVETNQQMLQELRELRKESTAQKDAIASLAAQVAGNKSQQSGGLLNRTDKLQNLYPLLEHWFRGSPYLQDAEMLTIIFKYAGVKDLKEFKRKYAPNSTARNFIHPKELNNIKKVARKHMKSNVRFKRADIVRTRAKYVYTRIMDRTVNDPNPLTQDALLTDLRFRDTPSGMCDQRPFEAVVTSYYALVAPDSTDTIWDMCLTVHEVGFITNEIHKQLSGQVGTKKSSHNEQHEQDKRAVEAYATELSMHLEDPEAPKPRFQIVDFAQLPEPDVETCTDDVVV